MIMLGLLGTSHVLAHSDCIEHNINLQGRHYPTTDPGENRLGEVEYVPVHTVRKQQYLDLELSLCLIKAFFP